MKTMNHNKSSKNVSSTSTSSAAAPATPAGSPAPAPAVALPINPPPASPAPATITGVANGGQPTKLSLQAAFSALASGLLANYAPTDVFKLSTGDQTRDEVVATLNEYVQAAEETKAARDAYLGSVQSERQTFALVEPTRQGVVSIIKGRYGKSSRTLLQYGITPTQPRKKTVATLTAAVAKSQATRAARGTKGKKAKLKIKGTVPASPPPAPAAVASPAASVATAPAAVVLPAAPAAKPPVSPSTPNQSNGA